MNYNSEEKNIMNSNNREEENIVANEENISIEEGNVLENNRENHLEQAKESIPFRNDINSLQENTPFRNDIHSVQENIPFRTDTLGQSHGDTVFRNYPPSQSQENIPFRSEQTSYPQMEQENPNLYQNSFQNPNNFQNFNQNAMQDNKREFYKKTKKKNSAGKKMVVLLASALMFGCIAGGSMIGIQMLAKSLGLVPETKTTVIGRSVSPQAEMIINTTDTTGKGSNSSGVTDVTSIVEKAMPAVVAINAETELLRQSWFGETQTYIAPTSGSGIIIGENEEELLIVTNNHVVEDTNALSVVFIDETEVKATVKGGDADSDLAVISVKLADLSQETKEKIDIATIGNSDALKVGQGVVAIGNALGYGQSVTVGYVSALNRDVETSNGIAKGFIQTDAAINPGNSGGALLNMNGEVIGINSVKYSSTKVEGMGYAIPITAVQDIIAELSTKVARVVVAEAEQGTIGMQGQDIDEQMSEAYDIPKGVYVYKILENGAAAKSELQEKDIITKIDNESIDSMEELKKNLTYYKAGDTITLTIQRLNGSQYEEKIIELNLGKKRDLQ